MNASPYEFFITEPVPKKVLEPCGCLNAIGALHIEQRCRKESKEETMQMRRYTHSQAQIALAGAILIAILPVLAFSQSSTALDADTFRTIDFPGALTTGGPGTRLGINSEGQVVGRYKSPDGRFHG